MNRDRGSLWSGPGGAPGPLAEHLHELSQFQTTIWTLMEGQMHR